MAISKTKSDYKIQIKRRLLKDQEGIKPADVEAALLEAVQDVYSKINPDLHYWNIEDADVDGTIQSWEVPSTYEDGFSYIKSVEYPVGEDPPEYLEEEEYDIYYNASDDKFKFRMFEDAPDSDETVLVIFTKRHTLTSSSNTIPDADFYAVCNIAAEKLCLILASLHAGDSDSTISADSVRHENVSTNFLKMAKEFRKKWQDYFGISDKESCPAAFVFHDEDLSSGIDKGDLIFHGRKSR